MITNNTRKRLVGSVLALSATFGVACDGLSEVDSGTGSGVSLGTEGGVIVAVSKNVYQSGEEVGFTITNNSGTPVYYTYGCSRPFVYKLEDQGPISLTVDILESIPDTNTIEPEETRTCSWDQKVWQDPDRTDNSRWQHYQELAAVPPGRYQFRLDYFLNESDVQSPQKAKTSRSQPFTVK